MYSLDQIRAAGADAASPMLRQFIGNAEMGWKVAWSDRMVSMYTSLLFFGWLYWPLFALERSDPLRRGAAQGRRAGRRRVRPLPFWAVVVLLMPTVIDGLTHIISDLAGIGQGFRDTNTWLATLTGNGLPASFYAGDALGSFNSWLRLITGVLFGLGVARLTFPYLAASMDDTARRIEAKFQRAGVRL